MPPTIGRGAAPYNPCMPASRSRPAAPCSRRGLAGRWRAARRNARPGAAGASRSAEQRRSREPEDRAHPRRGRRRRDRRGARTAARPRASRCSPRPTCRPTRCCPTTAARARQGQRRNRQRRHRRRGSGTCCKLLSAAWRSSPKSPTTRRARCCSRLGLGELRELRGIEGGIENTNYFVTTDQRRVRADAVRAAGVRAAAVLPAPDEAPGAARHPGARPGADPRSRPTACLRRTRCECGKPAAVVNRLAGHSELAPTARALRRSRRACWRACTWPARDFAAHQPNLRGLRLVERDRAGGAAPPRRRRRPPCCAASWPTRTTSPHRRPMPRLPRGPVHADLFRDNVMFARRRRRPPRLTGFFDFYFAGIDTWLFDLAVCLNDWCIDLATGAHDAARADALLAAYAAVRPLSGAERALLPAMLRAGALRFWISRLWDFHLPREASMLKAARPDALRAVLRAARLARAPAECASAGPVHAVPTSGCRRQRPEPEPMKLQPRPGAHRRRCGSAAASRPSSSGRWPSCRCSSCSWRWCRSPRSCRCVGLVLALDAAADA